MYQVPKMTRMLPHNIITSLPPQKHRRAKNITKKLKEENIKSVSEMCEKHNKSGTGWL